MAPRLRSTQRARRAAGHVGSTRQPCATREKDTMNRFKLRLPKHLESRRNVVALAFQQHAAKVEIAHTRLLAAVDEYNHAVALMNRTVDHAQGWVVQAAAVIDLNVAPDRDHSSPEGRAVDAWLAEYRAKVFRLIPGFHTAPIRPNMTHQDELQALPSFCDDPASYSNMVEKGIAFTQKADKS